MGCDDHEEGRLSGGLPGRRGSEGLRLETPRLFLQKPHRRDLSLLTKEIGRAQVACNLATVPHPYSFIDATSWFGAISAGWGVNSFTFGLYEKRYPDELIGVVSIDSLLARHNPCPSIGYWLAVRHWRRGLMSEAVGAVLAFSFERLNAPCIEATYLEANRASGRVMEKNGFKQVKQTLLWSRYRQVYLPGCLMRLDHADWQTKNRGAVVLP